MVYYNLLFEIKKYRMKKLCVETITGNKLMLTT